MKKTELLTREVWTIVEVLCNKCGESCGSKSMPSEIQPPDFNGLIEVRVDGCYSSDHLRDCTAYRFSICEKCLVELFSTFKIKPDIFDTDVYGNQIDVDTGLRVLGDLE